MKKSRTNAEFDDDKFEFEELDDVSEFFELS
jgi:hypothetical protein